MNFVFLFQFWVVAIAGRINAYQHAIIAYKDEEICCLREQLMKATGKERMPFTNKRRIRLAAKVKKIGRATLGRSTRSSRQTRCCGDIES